MQLKLRRTQKQSGMMSKKVLFALDARVELTEDEMDNVRKYKLGDTVIYSSQNAEKYAGIATTAADTMGGAMKALASSVASRLSLNISVDNLVQGKHIECRDLEEMMGAEEAIMQGCRNLKMYLDTAATFDGREEVFDFEQEAARAA